MTSDWWPPSPEAVGSIATAGAAAFTAGLAWATRRLAEQTRQEVQAQVRPILIPARTERSATGWTTRALNVTPDGQVVLMVSNVGPGPAMDVTAAVSGVGAEPLPDGNNLLVAETRRFDFKDVGPDFEDGTVTLRYRDLADVQWVNQFRARWRAGDIPPDTDEFDKGEDFRPDEWWFDRVKVHSEPRHARWSPLRRRSKSTGD